MSIGGMIHCTFMRRFWGRWWDAPFLYSRSYRKDTDMKKQLFALFLCNLAILFIGFGVFPLLPVYASKFGLTPSMIGLYLALTYIAISVGTMLPGWLSGRISQKLVFVAPRLLRVPALRLFGDVTEVC